ncbi:hypothetical protein GCM10011574_62110 [Microbispora bryophytorum]|uniref:Uncharacterized protein n=1 Tax=Microbispora bryophytorum TaxID=1460882 RepID=A0A8H9H5N6_9ACTN|nr:hypothetical protein GCM10011574_62110 [Microbispora bryophytorum]
MIRGLRARRAGALALLCDIGEDIGEDLGEEIDEEIEESVGTATCRARWEGNKGLIRHSSWATHACGTTLTRGQQ